jgi:hypothetical protein
MEEELAQKNVLKWNETHYSFGTEVFIPMIYEGPILSSTDLSGFNAVSLNLNGTISSDLNWKEAREEALKAIDQGFFLFWNMDLGLFADLSFSLSDQTQYAALTMSVNHFCESLWKEFSDQTIGLCLYRGNADFNSMISWDASQRHNFQNWLKRGFEKASIFSKEIEVEITGFHHIDENLLKKTLKGRQLLQLFCCDVVAEYLDLLIVNVPDALQPYLLFDTNISEINDHPALWAQLISKERFARWHCAITKSPLPLQDLSWRCQSSPFGFINSKPLLIPSQKQNTIGFCLASMEYIRPSYYKKMNEVLKQLIKNETSFRIISEIFLISEWDGLDYLLVVAETVNLQMRRKLQGFCAAGGTVVTIGEKLGLVLEMTIDGFLCSIGNHRGDF